MRIPNRRPPDPKKLAKTQEENEKLTRILDKAIETSPTKKGSSPNKKRQK